MKLLTGGLTLAAMLCCMPASQAELVLDSFNDGNFALLDPPGGALGTTAGTLGDDVAGSYSYTVAGGLLTGGVGGIVGSFTAIDSGAAAISNGFTLSYTGLPNLDLHSAGAFAGSPLLLDLFETVVGTFELDVTYHSGADSASVNDIAISSAGPVGINGSDFGNGALASSVTGIDLAFRVTGLDAGTGQALISASDASIAAVPEPASMALLGLTALGGVFVARRRRKQTEAVA